MARRKSARWSAHELRLLRSHYPAEGSTVAARLPARSRHAIQVMAHKLGIETTHRSPAPATRLQGASLDEAIRLREIDKLSFAAIGRHFGICEASACNAVTIALCKRRGYRPAERADHAHKSFSFDEQLARVAAGEVGITSAFVRHHLQPLITP